MLAMLAMPIPNLQATTLKPTATAYTLEADPGTYTVSGSDTLNQATRTLDAEPGSYAVSGLNALLVSGQTLDAEPGSYAITGNDAELLATRTLDASPGSYAVTGVDALLVADRALEAEPGSYATTGADAILAQGHAMDVDPGSYAVSGADAELLATRTIDAAPGSYAVTGNDAELLYTPLAQAPFAIVQWPVPRRLKQDLIVHGFSLRLPPIEVSAYTLDASPGSYGITGFDAEFLRTSPTLPRAPLVWRFAKAQNRVALIPQALNRAILSTAPAAYTLDAAPGSYAISGIDAELLRASPNLPLRVQPVWRFARAQNRIALIPQVLNRAVLTVIPGQYDLLAAAGVYSISGTDSLLVATRTIDASPGSYATTGLDTLLSRGQMLDAAPGAYAVSGADITSSITWVLNAEAGSYAIAGSDVELLYIPLPPEVVVIPPPAVAEPFESTQLEHSENYGATGMGSGPYGGTIWAEGTVFAGGFQSTLLEATESFGSGSVGMGSNPYGSTTWERS